MALTGNTIRGYHIGNFTGISGYGQVYNAQRNGMDFSLKFFSYSEQISEEAFTAELKAYGALSIYPTCYQYLLCEYEHFLDQVLDRRGNVLFQGGVIVHEMMDTNLLELSKEFNTGLPPTMLVKVMRDLLSGVSYIHSQDYAHTDLKLDYFYVQGKGEIKIIRIGDLGQICKDNCVILGTFHPPEWGMLELGTPVSTESARQADIWALGVAFWKLAYGYLPYPVKGKTSVDSRGWGSWNPSPQITQSEMKKSDYHQNVGRVSKFTIDYILNSMVSLNPEARPSATYLISYLDADMEGCTIKGKVHSRSDLNQMMVGDLGQYLFSEKHIVPESEINLGDLCGIIREYLERKTCTRDWGRKKEEIERSQADKFSDWHRAEMAKQRKKYEEDCLRLRASDETRLIALHQSQCEQIFNRKAQQAEKEMDRKYLLEKAKLESRVEEKEEAEEIEMKCSILQREIPPDELKNMAQALGISTEGSRNDICQRVTKYIMEDRTIKRNEITRNVISIMATAAEEDVNAGLTQPEGPSVSQRSQDLVTHLYNLVGLLKAEERSKGREIIDEGTIASEIETLRKYPNLIAAREAYLLEGFLRTVV